MDRLQEIKKALPILKLHGELKEDIDWLIEQAEKVELLEKREKEILGEWGKRDTKLIKIQEILNS